MNKNIELIKNTAIIFIGKFCTQFISFLLVPIYTNFLNPNDYGYIDLLQTYISLIVPILILRFDSAIFRFLIDVRNDSKEIKRIISNTTILLLIQIVIFSIIFLICIKFLNIKYASAIFINVIFMAMSSFLLQAVRGMGDNLGYSISSIMAGSITILLNILFIVVLKLDGSSILIASAISNALCSIFLIFRKKIYKFINLRQVDKNKMKEMLTYSLPMIPDGLSWWVVNVSDRTIISFMINSAANGIYAVSSKFSNILSSLFQIFNMSWQESASLHINDEDREKFFTSILNRVYRIFFSICIIILAGIPFLFDFVIGKKFSLAYLYIPPLLLGNLYNAIANVIGGIYIAKKQTNTVARTTVLAASINILINLIMIKKWGVFAAAISTLISYIILTIYRYIDIRKYIKIKLEYKMMIYTHIIYGVLIFLYYNNARVINLILTILVSYILNKYDIRKIVNKIIKKRRIR